MNGYRDWIVAATGCSTADAVEVEEVMRHRWCVLDGLRSAEFKREARLAWAVVQELRKKTVVTR